MDENKLHDYVLCKWQVYNMKICLCRYASMPGASQVQLISIYVPSANLYLFILKVIYLFFLNEVFLQLGSVRPYETVKSFWLILSGQN